jgi:uncharacterized protein YegP (UPF0339 family)
MNGKPSSSKTFLNKWKGITMTRASSLQSKSRKSKVSGQRPSKFQEYGFELYEDQYCEWRWRLVAYRNGKTIADSGEGYENKSNAARAVQMILKASVFCAEQQSLGYAIIHPLRSLQA